MKTDVEIGTRSNLAKAKFSSMSKILTSKRLKLKTRLKILKCYIYSIFTYGCEAWTPKKVLEDKIEAFEMWCLREIGQVKWKDNVTNVEVLRRLGTERQLLNDIQKRKLRYYGHIKRKNNILTTIVEGRLEGRRPRGRPLGTAASGTLTNGPTCRPMTALGALLIVICGVSLHVDRRRGDDTPRYSR